MLVIIDFFGHLTSSPLRDLKLGLYTPHGVLKTTKESTRYIFGKAHPKILDRGRGMIEPPFSPPPVHPKNATNTAVKRPKWLFLSYLYSLKTAHNMVTRDLKENTW